MDRHRHLSSHSRHPHHDRHDQSERAGGQGDYHRRHHRRHSDPLSLGHTTSVSCVAGSFLALIILAVAHIIASIREEPSNAILSAAAAVLAAGSFLSGFYAAIVQIRYPRPRAGRRLMLGLPAAILVFIVIGGDLFKRYARLDPGDGHPHREEPPREAAPGDPDAPRERPAPAAGTGKEADPASAPRWYGEGRRDGLEAALVAFPENAAESRRFNQRVSRAVSYAALAVMNLGKTPAEMGAIEPPVLKMENGSEMKSLPVPEYPGERAGRNADLPAAPAPGGALPPGGMSAVIPVCMPPAFDWADVSSVRVKIGGKVLEIKGRMMTAEERRPRPGAGPAAEDGGRRP